MGKTRTRQPQQRTKPDLVTKEEWQVYYELRRHIDAMSAEERAMLLLIARETVQPGAMYQMMFNARAI